MTFEFIFMSSALFTSVMAGYFFYIFKTKTDYVGHITFVAMIWGCGPRLLEYSVFDELTIFGLVAFLVIFYRNSVIDIWQECKSSPSFNIISILCGFLVLQSIRGAIVLDDWRALKWVAVFASLPFVLHVFMRFLSVSDHKDQSRRAFILWNITLYFLAYATQGIIADSYFELNGRFVTQHQLWQGSALAVMPCAIFIFLVCKWLVDGTNLSQKILILITHIVMSFCAFYFDSRLLQLLLIVFVICTFFHAFREKLLWLFLLFTLMLSFTVNVLIYDSNLQSKVSWDNLTDSILNGVHHLVSSVNIASPDNNDVDRLLQVKAAFSAVLDSPERFLIGDGFYVHRYTITPFVKTHFESGLRETFIMPDDAHFDPQDPMFRSTGLAGVLVDVGLAGAILMCYLLWVQLRNALRKSFGETLMTVTKVLCVLGLSYVAFSPENMLIFALAFPLFLPGHGERREQSKIVNIPERL